MGPKILALKLPGQLGRLAMPEVLLNDQRCSIHALGVLLLKIFG
jgi:hypothetical protein